MARLIHCFHHQGAESRVGRAATFRDQFAFGDTNNATWLADALVFFQQLWPVPGAQVADSEALIDQIKVVSGKGQIAQGVHDVKFHTVTDSLSLSLRVGIIYHFFADIHPDEQLDVGIGLCQFDEPAAGAAAHIEHALKTGGPRQFREHSSHANSGHLVLDLQTGHFFPVGAVLYKIGAGLFLAWIGLVWHSICTPCSFSCPLKRRSRLDKRSPMPLALAIAVEPYSRSHHYTRRERPLSRAGSASLYRVTLQNACIFGSLPSLLVICENKEIQVLRLKQLKEAMRPSTLRSLLTCMVILNYASSCVLAGSKKWASIST